MPTGGSAPRLGEAFDSVPAGARGGAPWAWEAIYRWLAPVGHSNRVTVSFGTL